MTDKRDQRRREIRRLAAELFLERGFDAVSVRELAEAAGGVTLPTLYWYIGSKHQLLVDIYESMQAENLERFLAVAQTEGSADQKLRALVREILHLQLGHRAEAGVYHREHARLDAAYKESQVPIRRQIDQIVRDVLDAGVREGLWDDSHALVGRMLFWANPNFFNQWFRPEGQMTLDEAADQVADFLIAGLKVRNTRGGASSSRSHPATNRQPATR
ncbi:MAG: TetR/AcrR family transcriptional regulator [Dehalococcoidia bacterium]|nr:TetR/AcrR family transcriptional regulator [Dehalococcoidia bacterium]